MTIRLSGLTVKRAQHTVLSDVSLTLAPGELLGVLGPNGAGKSSLIAVMSGELAFDEGAVELSSESLVHRSAFEQARRRAVVTQQSSLNFDLCVNEVVQMGAYPYPEAIPEQVERWAQRALALTELLPRWESLYTVLSGGEQQRVQLARALVQCFAIEHFQGVAFLLLDEPLANLDPRHQVHFMQALKELVLASQIGVLIVMHDLNIAASYCDRLVLLDQGRAIAQGAPKEVLTPEALNQAFGLEWTVIEHPKHVNRLLVLC
jgi:iron complex transport system ATP-binding protein